MSFSTFIITICFALIVVAIYSMYQQRKQDTSIIEENNLSYEYGLVNAWLEYLGGHPLMAGIGNVKITAAKDALIWTGNKSININLDTLKLVEFKTESQITSDVTLSRLLLTGVIAFAWKKKTVHENTYLVFNFEELGVPYAALFKGKDIIARSQMAEIIRITNRNLIDRAGQKHSTETESLGYSI